MRRDLEAKSEGGLILWWAASVLAFFLLLIYLGHVL